MGYNLCACGSRKANHARMCRPCKIRDNFHGRTEITDAEVAWVAGIVEGEGCFTANRHAWWLAVRMTDLDIIERLQSVTGVGGISTSEQARPGHKQCYAWSVAGTADKEWLCELILPWLGARRRERLLGFLRT